MNTYPDFHTGKPVGYTHKIHYSQYRPILDMTVRTYLLTTQCMVDRHVQVLSRSKHVSNITVEKLQ